MINICLYVQLTTIVKANLKALFYNLFHQSVGEGATPFPGLLHLPLIHIL